jgi:AcrR family transcriptional regulator/DNA-binding MarR family transcriptional regulator
VEEAQRIRILEAMAEAMAVRGAGGASVSLNAIVAGAGITSGAFHEAFPDREACLLATFELGLARARKRVLAAYDAEARWLDAIKGALAAFLGFLEDEPALGRVLVIYSISGGEEVLQRRVGVIRELAAVVDRGRDEGPAGRSQPPAVIAEGVVGAVTAVLQNRLLGGGDGVMDLYGSLVSIVVLPYLGASAARRELARPLPRPRAVGGAGEEALAHEDGRPVALTYRTRRVLGAIASYPGASNREVADRAGVVDQGQISKLLGRLHARGLIFNAGEAPARGAPNAWRLTERGERLIERGEQLIEDAEDQASSIERR